MGTKHSIEVSITPLCSSCGAELECGIVQSKHTGHPFERDNPYERKHQRLFVEACPKCYTFTGGRATTSGVSNERG